MSDPRPVGRFGCDRRLRKRREFERVQGHGRRVTTPHFVLLLAMRESETDLVLPRLGIAASRRVGVAVVRNRAKRLVREAFRATPDLWAAGIELVVVVRRALGRMKLGDVIAEWRAVERAIRRRTAEARHDRAQSPLAQGQ